MKNYLWIAIMIFCHDLWGFHVSVTVCDENENIIEAADVAIGFVNYQKGATVGFEGQTDSLGEFSADGVGNHSVLIRAKKKGHYSSELIGLPKDQDLDVKVIIPRIINPIPLYANNVRFDIPSEDEWIGFDFEVSDWMAPYGEGKTEDIRFKFNRKFLRYRKGFGGKNLEAKMAEMKRAFTATNREWSEEIFKLTVGIWHADLQVAFPGEKEGLYEESYFLDYNQLKLPYEAPVDGYVSTKLYQVEGFPLQEKSEKGLFFRTRVVLDNKGNIISAHYTKFLGDIYLDPRGIISFLYYFNPNPNDRNLEFDPKQNLLPKDKRQSAVIYP